MKENVNDNNQLLYFCTSMCSLTESKKHLPDTIYSDSQN